MIITEVLLKEVQYRDSSKAILKLFWQFDLSVGPFNPKNYYLTNHNLSLCQACP